MYLKSLESFIIDCSGDKPLPLFGHSLAMINSVKVCLFGGVTGTVKKLNYLNDTYIYNIMNRKQIKINFNQKDAVLPCKRAAHAAASNDNMEMIIYGGSNESGIIDDKLWILNLGNQNEGIWFQNSDNRRRNYKNLMIFWI